MADEPTEEETGPVTMEDIREWEEEHDEPHPAFRVDHRPERDSFISESQEADE